MNRAARSSIFTPGPAGFGSACTTRARLARYGPAAALETLKAMRSPGAAESRSLYPVSGITYPRNCSHTSSQAWVVRARDSTSTRSSLPWKRPDIASAVSVREKSPKP